MVASSAEIFIPHFSKRGNQVLHSAPRNRHTGMDDVSPGMDSGAFGSFLKGEPLSQGDANRMVDPAHSLTWGATGDDVINDHVDGMQQFNFHAASRLPRLAFAPAKVPVDVRELIPTPPVCEHLPSQAR